jgi:hypothetical protein
MIGIGKKGEKMNKKILLTLLILFGLTTVSNGYHGVKEEKLETQESKKKSKISGFIPKIKLNTDSTLGDFIKNRSNKK